MESIGEIYYLESNLMCTGMCLIRTIYLIVIEMLKDYVYNII